MLRSDLCDFSDAYIVFKGTITAEQNTKGNNDGHNKPFASKPIQGGPFRDCSRTGSSQKGLPKICYTFPILMKLGTVIPYLRKIQKLHIARDTALDLC